MAHEWIAGGDRVGLPAGGMRVDAEYLGEQGGEILADPVRVALGAAVAEPDVEVAVRAERHQPPVVVGIRLVHGQDLPGA